MSVTLRKRKNADGSTSLRLDIYNKGKRTIETLEHLKLSKGTSLIDRAANKKNFQEAKEIKIARAGQLQASGYSMVSDAAKKTIVTVCLQYYVDSYTKKDKRNMQGALNRFSDYLIEQKQTGLTFGKLSAPIIDDFIDYLESKSTGEGAGSYYGRFRKMIRQAYRKELMSVNVLDFVEKRVKGKAKKKEILTIAELTTLAATHTESTEVKRAFLFSCVTGLRWCDVKAITWAAINLPNRQMSVKQSKTGETVVIPLNDTAIDLLGLAGKPTNKIFDLPSANGANKTVKAWVNRAQIEKKITWHNARHSFGTNLIYNNVDVLTASKLLGHASMKHTQRYVDASKEMKQNATDAVNIKLPINNQ